MCDLGAQSKHSVLECDLVDTQRNRTGCFVKVASGTLKHVANDRGAEELFVGKHQ